MKSKSDQEESWLPASVNELDPFEPFQNKDALVEKLKSSAENLKSHNLNWGLWGKNLKSEEIPKKSWLNFEKLKNGEGVAVVTGQQPGLLLGSGLLIYKICTLLSICRWLKKECGVIAVPVFWCASEDHDLAEIFRASHIDERGHLRNITLSGYKERLASEGIEWSDELTQILHEELPKHLKDSVLKNKEKGGRYVDHFKSILYSLFGKEGLLIVEPKDLLDQADLFWEKVSDRTQEIVECFEKDERELIEGGNPLQVSRRQAIPVFSLNEKSGERLPLDFKNGEWSRRGETKSYKSIFDLLRKGERLSPGALLRPLLASDLLPHIISVLGPAEWLYHQQNISAYLAMGIERPLLWPRIKGVWLPSEVNHKIEELGLGFKDIYYSELKSTSFVFDREWQEVYLSTNALRTAVYKELGGSDVGDIAQFEKMMNKSVRRLKNNLFKKQLSSDRREEKKIREIQNFLWPHGRDQERVIGATTMLQNKDDLSKFMTAFENPLDFNRRFVST